MSQSKRHSALETATNTAVGFVGSYALTILCMQHVHLNAAQQSLLIVVLCTVWSLLRGYYLRRLFNHLHTKPVVNEELERQVPVNCCKHLYVEGFGGMGDAVVCCKCGVDKYPEAAPDYKLARLRRRVIACDHPDYEYYAGLARVARGKAQAQ